MENGRCCYHGGRTPKGAGWHRPRWPDRASPAANDKLGRKLKDLDRAARKRARRLEAMTPEDRAAHQAWQLTHQPGDPKRRAADRERRRQARAAAALLAGDPVPAPISADARQIEDYLARLRAELDRHQRPTIADDNLPTTGVFS